MLHFVCNNGFRVGMLEVNNFCMGYVSGGQLSRDKYEPFENNDAV